MPVKAKKAAPKKKATPTKKAAPKKKATPKKSAAPKKKPAPKKKARAIEALDLSAFPAESIDRSSKHICLACVLDVFTRHMGLAAKTAWTEIQRYQPQLAEVRGTSAARPYFSGDGDCPYCGSPARWHATLPVARIESGKATDAPRRELLKSLPTAKGQFAVLEEKATQQHAFFEWLDKISAGFDLEQPVWLRDISGHYLSRKFPKEDWMEQLRGVHAIRRSRRLEEGWEFDAGRLFLAPMLFDELLLVQYLVSRAQKAGGLTLEGRYTLPELFMRLRNSGYLRSVGVEANNPGDALEMLLQYLSGGEGSLKFYYIVDRREYLEKAKDLQTARLPKPKSVG